MKSTCFVAAMLSFWMFGGLNSVEEARMALETVVLSTDSKKAIHQNFNLQIGEPFKISFVAGPGDVCGTFNYWRQKKHDERVPVVTYSGMLYDLIEELEGKLQVITPYAPPEGFIRDKNFQFDQVYRRPFRNRFEYISSQWGYGREVASKINKFSPHVVIASTDFPAMAWRKIGRKRPFIMSVHNTFWPKGRQPISIKDKIKNQLLSIYSKGISDAVCTSLECSRQLNILSGGRINGLCEFPQLAQRYPANFPQKPRRVLYAGRIERNKGIFDLLDSFIALTNIFPDLELVFIGSGQEERELIERIEDVGSERVSFLGRLGAKDVHSRLAKTDLVVCPTTSDFNEGLLLVALEAASHGVPAVLSSVVPAAELLEDACVVFEADDVSDLTAKISAIIDDRPRYELMAKSAYRVSGNMYDRSLSWVSQLVQVLERLKTP